MTFISKADYQNAAIALTHILSHCSAGLLDRDFEQTSHAVELLNDTDTN